MQNDPKLASSIFEFTANDIDGNPVPLTKYRGYVCLIVNVASLCGLSEKNFSQLEELYKIFSEKGLRILAFPSNQFAKQEPGTSQEIKKRIMEKFSISFDLFEKINVNGEDAHPLYKFLQNAVPGTLVNAIKWNYTKFLTDRNGVPVKRYAPTTAPMDMEPEIRALLEKQ
ncbi:hypothetical protein P879_03271 [Paragonimus westermani]|uniref:Glutathione peroxidase n=1 Tax=Paragonimus westermani TaxID=34504 RepID=A0A8T0DFZ6_9TREM|nr:hypothetical protein P879_03271 [Paragonimus westermani]